ncbi:hypothetical protein VNI00_009488 [Paramarasmius palmivorus]|uniref:F-box domain-containing protein n=1 Tax=Paramarasmius palmivorus TaxID=297713 RepID=A0AAW0CQI2_9AGAR
MYTNGPPFSSPFTHLLTTNYAPTKQETQQIYSILEQPKEKLHTLNDEVTQLQASLANAIARRDAMQRHIEAHQALLSPFRHLPMDVVREIFVHCLPEPLPVRSTSEAPLLLTLVCKSWRQLALTTPRLWCSLHLFIPKLFQLSELEAHVSLVDRRTEGVGRWLERSGSLPLTLSLAMSVDRTSLTTLATESPDPRLKQSKTALVEMFMRFSRRWKDVYFQMPFDYVARVGAIAPEEIPRLESLRVYSLLDRIPTEQVENPHPLDNLMSHATSLRAINMFGESRNPLNLPITWSNLTEIVLHPSYDHEHSFMAPGDVLHIFRECHHRLQKCSLWIRIPQNNTAEEYAGIRLVFPFLRSLQLRLFKSWEPNVPEDGGFLHAEDVTPFLQTISAPALLSLCVKTDDAAPMENCPFLSILAQPGCQIQELHSNLPMSENAFLECLGASPSLLRIVTTCACSDPDWRRATYPAAQNAVIRALTPSCTQDGQLLPGLLCPLLEQVSFTYSDPSNASALMDFVVARMRLRGLTTASGTAHVAKLRKFHTTFSGRVSDEYRDAVERARAQGLDIIWKFFDRGRKHGPDSPRTGQMIFDAMKCGTEAPHTVNSYHMY